MTDRDITRNPTFRNTIRERYGDVCINCGSTEAINYHHIVPLELGGTNRITNIAPLCKACHIKAHRMTPRKKTYANKGRRKVVLPENGNDILTSYVWGSVGKQETQDALNMEQGQKLNDKWYYKQYLKDHHIVKHHNYLDAIRNPKTLVDDRLLAFIEYEDGRYIEITKHGNGRKIMRYVGRQLKEIEYWEN